MPAFVKVGGTWRQFNPNMKVGGVWKTATGGWVKVAGVWRKFYPSISGPPVVNYAGSTFGTAGGNQSATFTPAVGDLIVIMACGSAGTNVVTGCSDDQGGTYTEVVTSSRSTTQGELTCFVRNSLVTSAVSHTVTATMSGNDGGGCIALTVSNMLATGAAAVRGSGAHNSIAAGTACSPALSAGVPLSKDPIISADFVGSTNLPGARAGYTAWFSNTYSSPSSALRVISRDSGETSNSITWASGPGAGQHCGLAIELAAP